MPAPLPDPESMPFGQRIRYYFATPWWRAAWFIGSIVWAIVFNYLYISGGGEDETLGVISIIPIFAFVFDQQSRARKLRQAKAEAARIAAATAAKGSAGPG